MQFPTVETFVVDSAKVDDRLEVAVAQPAESKDGEPLAVVYALDPGIHAADDDRGGSMARDGEPPRRGVRSAPARRGGGLPDE